jgi:L-iditol 2-dehydrogenase
MKAAVVYGANDIRIEEVQCPVPEPGDIVVRVRASGICATDIKTLLGQGLPKDLPTILGHEVAGEVSAFSVSSVSSYDFLKFFLLANSRQAFSAQ